MTNIRSDQQDRDGQAYTDTQVLRKRRCELTSAAAAPSQPGAAHCNEQT